MPTYSPTWAPHVVGTYPERVIDRETGEADPQLVEMVCTICRDTHRVKCTTGAVRQWILRFAANHIHRDPLAPIPKKEVNA